MHEIAKYEFLSWVDSLETENLTEHEMTLLSILINSFEDIASVGTASGLRAKMLYLCRPMRPSTHIPWILLKSLFHQKP